MPGARVLEQQGCTGLLNGGLGEDIVKKVARLKERDSDLGKKDLGNMKGSSTGVWIGRIATAVSHIKRKVLLPK